MEYLFQRETWHLWFTSSSPYNLCTWIHIFYINIYLHNNNNKYIYTYNIWNNNSWLQNTFFMQISIHSKTTIHQLLLYKYRLLMREMVENYRPEVKFNLSLLFTEVRRAEVNSRLRLNFTEGAITFYHSPNKRAVNICFIHLIHRFCSLYRTV